ncbi:putative transcription factor bHLH041 [Primulina huaijiensis]|uniref:putative transcription factor bHLH041 n=1 Tax=Primulina huaijiensis TaxID=1492673 RepID=UPI003CC76F02
MDSIFHFDKGDRSSFLLRMIQSVGSCYICLWSFPPQSYNFLSFLDGIYQEISSQQQSSSSRSLARRLFDAYSQSMNYMDTGRIPGFAFMNHVPYVELKEHDFQRMASSKAQLDFYQEAGIKTVVFMSCSQGEIELGMRNEPRLGLEMEIMNNIFQVIDFTQQAASALVPQPAVDQNLPSSSSSSLRSLSFDSPDRYSPLMFNIPTTSLVQEPQREAIIQESHIENALNSVPFLAPSLPFSSSHQQAIQDASQIQNFPIMTESADAAMTKAILAVLSSSSTSSPTLSIAPNFKVSPVSQNATPFQRYRMALAPVAARNRKSSMFRRAVVFYRSLHSKRSRELAIQENRPTPAQLHHMINERKRREKLNESFQLLRSLIPVGSKKDKASVLTSTTEYLSSLKSKVEELSERNQILEGRLLNRKEPIIQESVEGPSSSSSVQERVNVEMNRVPESTSEARILDLSVTVRGECRMLDLVSGILEFLKQQRNLTLMSIESNAIMEESYSVHGLVLRLRIEGDEFDESNFQEAVRRVVDDSTH